MLLYQGNILTFSTPVCHTHYRTINPSFIFVTLIFFNPYPHINLPLLLCVYKYIVYFSDHLYLLFLTICIQKIHFNAKSNLQTIIYQSYFNKRIYSFFNKYVIVLINHVQKMGANMKSTTFIQLLLERVSYIHRSMHKRCVFNIITD